MSTVSCGVSLLWFSEVDCGPPPALPHARAQWSKSSKMGATVLYQCIFGYQNVGRGNTSMCTAAGRWETPAVLCQGTVTGSSVCFVSPGFLSCTLTVLVETLCGSPPVVESTEQVWDGSSTPGSTALYLCKEGFSKTGGHNVSVCGENGQWTLPTLRCQGNSNYE